MRSRVPLVGLLVLLGAVVCVVSVSGAGFTQSTSQRRHHVPQAKEGRGATFPTREEIAADPELARKYTGDNQLQIHVNCHTHDDVGWLKTVDQYYLGANNSIQHAAVKYILDTVVEELMKDPERKFIYVEQAFFQMWWTRQTAEVKANVRGLVANGQLEFINGGWCMHDEANTHYLDMIDQTTLGHQFILQEFGVTPKIGWQIDPFGHSSTQAALLSAKVGFEGLFFGRIDHQDHDQRMKAQNMEFIWRGSPSLGEGAQIFSGAFQDGNYGAPTGFCFDISCGQAPMITDETFIDYNVPDRVQAFLDQVNYQAEFTKGVHLMVNMGSDFNYESARQYYQNLDALISAVNADGRVRLFYSTPSLYVAAKNAENLTFTVKTDDFFPYSDDDNSYWTGYFTSRPALKRYVRTSSALLQSARHLELFAGGDGADTMPFSQAVGVVQHHDAVAGTAKQHVAFDYAQRLHIAQTKAQTMMATALAQQVSTDYPNATLPAFEFCELANITVCRLTTTTSPTSFQVTFYNPLARKRQEVVSIPISDAQVVVVDGTGAAVQAQVTTTFNVSSHTPESAQQQLHFLVEVQGLGYATYFIQPAQTPTDVFIEDDHLHSPKQTTLSPHAQRLARRAKTFVSAVRSSSADSGDDFPVPDTTLSNGLVAITFDGATGAVKSYTNGESNVTKYLGVEYAFYSSYAAQNAQASGAYIFRPATQALPASFTVSTTLLVQQGPIVQLAVQRVNEWINQTFRVLQGQSWVEVEYTVGSIPIDDGDGKEVVIQYQTQLASDGQWFTDSNAREMIPRYRNYRTSFNLTVTQPIAGNYMPMNAAAFLTDNTTQLTVLNDRSQGCTSLQDGVLEIMLHRRTLKDDGRGVGEPINETDYMSPYPDFIRRGPGLIITGKHYLFLTPTNGSAAQWRPVMQRVYQPLVEAYAALPIGGVPEYIASHHVDSSWLGGTDLPVNVDLISLQTWAPWTNDTAQRTMMVRLAHQFAVDEDADLSQPVQVDLSTLFSVAPTNIQPMSLTLTKEAGQVATSRLQWNTEETDESEASRQGAPEQQVPIRGDTTITINPMDIQTFLLTF